MYPSSFLERVHIKIIIMYPIMLFFWLMKSQPWKGNEHKISKSNQSQSIMKRHVSTQSRVPPPPPPLLLHVNDRHFFFLVHQPLPPYLVASSRHSKKIYRSPTMASDRFPTLLNGRPHTGIAFQLQSRRRTHSHDLNCHSHD